MGTTPTDLLNAMNAAGIDRMVVVGFGPEVPELPVRHPSRFVAAYVLYNFRWRQDARFDRLIPADLRIKDGTSHREVEAIGAEFETALKTGLYNALAEITTVALPIRGGAIEPGQSALPGSTVSPDSPLVMRLMELAARYDLPINIHCESTAKNRMARALAANRAARVIWAHTGSYLAPAPIATLLREHPNLDFDLSSKNQLYQARAGSVLSMGRVKEDWRQLFEAFPDRFYYGVDFLTRRQLSLAQAIGESARALFTQLSPPAARKIAYQNAIRTYRLGT
jgi:hypothetical protein